MGRFDGRRVRGVDPPTERTSVRVILLDAADRVLLLGPRDPDDGRTVWFMPGGGVEPGESFTETADRELREELGVSGLAFTGPVWTRYHDHTWDGRAIRQTEWFLLARTSRTLPADRIRPPRPEGDYFVGARWLRRRTFAGAPTSSRPAASPSCCCRCSRATSQPPRSTRACSFTLVEESERNAGITPSVRLRSSDEAHSRGLVVGCWPHRAPDLSGVWNSSRRTLCRICDRRADSMVAHSG
jgi:8-oxo-dGTP pyrophosphatase MutT (NUDIX family)